jgi:threonine dehydrogenase-like Zn-dependent dehydrogenase
MPLPERRTFLQTAAVGVAALALKPPTSAADSRRIVVGVIGPGGMGMNHVSNLVRRPDVEIAYVCDVDKNRLAAAAKAVEQGSKRAPKAVTDMRQLLDDKGVDAVFIATPDHWHSPAATRQRPSWPWTRTSMSTSKSRCPTTSARGASWPTR